MRNTLTQYAVAVLGIVGLVSATIYLGGVDPKTGVPDPVLGISFPYTDDLTGETLHIYTNTDAYSNGLSHAEVYVAVVNQSGVTQDVELLAYFTDTKKRVEDVSVLTTLTRVRQVPVVENICREVTSSTTQETTEVCQDEQTALNDETYETVEWLKLPLKNRTPQEVLKESMSLSKMSATSKAESTYTAPSKSQGFTINPGEVVYYKVIIQFEPNMPGSFFFEAIGSEGGYGHLK